MKHLFATLFMCAVSLSASIVPGWANCVSLVGRPEWPTIARALSSAKICEQLPAGPNHTQSFHVQSAELCRSADRNASLRATAFVTCESPPDALFNTPPMQAEIAVAVSIDERACRITDAQIQIGGELGSFLSNAVDANELVRQWKQSDLSQLCRQMQRVNTPN